MHKYLRAIGFSKLGTKQALRRLLDSLEHDHTYQHLIADPYTLSGTLEKEYDDRMGLAVFGDFEEGTGFIREAYYPYVYGDVVSSAVPCHIQKHAAGSTFSGMLDEPALDISLIFYLLNPAEFINRRRNGESTFITSVSLSALSTSGKILLPVEKTPKQIEKAMIARRNRNMLMEAAKNGDEKAMETLAIDDMELFHRLNGRVMQEDLYSIIDTSLMPFGVECDQYTMIGQILQVEEKKNKETGEEMYFMLTECNGLVFRVLINKQDLYGEPAVGRRFKGEIWLQGKANFVS